MALSITYDLAVFNKEDSMLGQRLREARMMRGRTQPEMAKLLDLSLRTYQKYEEGSRNPQLDTLVAIANALDVSTDWLLCRTDEK